MKILIVDDAADIRAWLKILLESAGWEVIQASNGLEACRILETLKIQIVITDWIMPGMDGISLVEWIRARTSRDYVYTILMTSLDQEDDCVKGLRCGADDFITKPASPAVLNARLSVATRILSIQQDLLNQQEQLRHSRDLVKHAFAMVQDDIEGASAAQRSLLPENGQISGAVETAWLYSPAMGVSGDCLDIYMIGPDKLAFYLLDVSGHGVTSALRSAAISQLLRPISGLMNGLDTEGPAHVMAKLNHHLCQGNPEIDYLATMVLGVFDAGNGILRIASAGHPPPLTLSQGQAVRTLTGNGIPLGIDSEAGYNDVESVLRPGETVLLYSDGLLECENRQGQQLGTAMLMRAARADETMAPAELLAQIERRLLEWSAGAEIKDDLSALALKYTGFRLISQPQSEGPLQWIEA